MYLIEESSDVPTELEEPKLPDEEVEKQVEKTETEKDVSRASNCLKK